MLIRLLSDQVSDMWDTIYPHIDRALPPITNNDESRSVDILEAILKNDMHCWVLSNGEDFKDVNGIMTTAITHEPVSNVRYLLVYSIYALDIINRKMWIDIYKTLRKFAKSLRCTRISFYTNVSGLIELTTNVRFAEHSHFITLDFSATNQELTKIGGN